MDTEFEQRLREVLADHPNADPERVKALLKRLEAWEKAQAERKALKDRDLT